MYARFVTTHLKPGDFKLATKLLEKDVIPLLKNQPGFRDEMAFFDKDKEEAVAISFWETKEDADKYERELYPKVRKLMEEKFDVKRDVRLFEVGNSTWYDIHA